MKKFWVILFIGGLLFMSPSAFAAMEPFYSLTAEGAGISIDAIGVQDNATGTVSAEIPANAVIQAAYLYSAAVGYSGSTLYDVTFAGTILTSDAASRLDVGTKGGNDWVAENRWDVTSIVSGVYDSAGGIYNFDVSESGYLDGEILAVAYSVAGGDVKTALIFDGELATTGDTFNINLSPAYDGSSEALFSLGISYGFQTNYDPPAQVTLVDVNGTRLTSSAGGEDDGYSANGGLITAGGVGDDPGNPPDPLSKGNGFGYDDELYSIGSFLVQGTNVITINTLNPSNDDNVFFSALTVKGEASTAVPEPATMLLLLGPALVGLVAGYRKKRR
jgi:hypothetical protein